MDEANVRFYAGVAAMQVRAAAIQTEVQGMTARLILMKVEE